MKNKKFLKGIKDGIPICLGYFSVSMAFGIAAVQLGLPAWSAVLMSLTNVTSAGQFAGAGILAGLGGYVELAITTLIINIRYFLMSLSVSQKSNMTLFLKGQVKMIAASMEEKNSKKREKVTTFRQENLVVR